MHSALLIDEILQEIIEACSAWSGQECRSSLCQIARCCKAWSDPALDRLWARLDGVTPLLRLLPEVSDQFHLRQMIYTSMDDLAICGFVTTHCTGASGNYMQVQSRIRTSQCGALSYGWVALLTRYAAPYDKFRMPHARLEVGRRCEMVYTW